MTKKEVTKLYQDWRAANRQQKPNRVIVRMSWEDGDNSESGSQVDTIGIILNRNIGNNPPKDDAMILYYVSSLPELLNLMKPNNGSDFVVQEVLEFYRV